MRRNKLEFGKGGTAMLRKLNCFLNIVIGSFIGVFIGFGIYKFWHFKTYPNLYVMQSAPWYTELLLCLGGCCGGRMYYPKTDYLEKVINFYLPDLRTV